MVMAEGMMVLVYGNRSVGGADDSVDGRGWRKVMTVVGRWWGW